MSKLTKSIGKELKMLRIASDYTLEDLSIKSKVHTSTLSRYELGNHDMKISTLEQIVSSYNIDTGFFMLKTLAKMREE